ncbi:hypothetical protein T08_2764 [Trichinella sp. T8]|nr:hypothetical protein T08_2764 [Trichinella sp. T8]
MIYGQSKVSDVDLSSFDSKSSSLPSTKLLVKFAWSGRWSVLMVNDTAPAPLHHKKNTPLPIDLSQG